MSGSANTGPAAARDRFRGGLVTPTAGWAAGYAQANLVAVPRADADDFLLFAQRNPKPCPVLDVTDPGSPHTVLAPGADLRTDVPRYRVFRGGRLIAEPSEVTAEWREDLVTFLIGCSFTFESALREAGVPLRHLDAGANVPMYITNRRCRPAGRFAGPLVVSMRPIPSELVATAVSVTAQVPAVHGAPVHSGAPKALGIDDLARPDFGDPIEPLTGEIPVFWACGVTTQLAVTGSAADLAITHWPGHMLITDTRDAAYRLTD